MRIDHARLIDDLGGPTELADRLPKVGRFAIYKWRERGQIPARHWPFILDLAREKGRKLSADDLMAA